jgi:hypothetical protein
MFSVWRVRQRATAANSPILKVPDDRVPGGGWRLPQVLGGLLKYRDFEFAVERAVFVRTLHRLFVSGSDRDCSSWMKDYDISGADDLDLYRFYRAMAWLGEELEKKPEGASAPRSASRT